MSNDEAKSNEAEAEVEAEGADTEGHMRMHDPADPGMRWGASDDVSAHRREPSPESESDDVEAHARFKPTEKRT